MQKRKIVYEVGMYEPTTGKFIASIACKNGLKALYIAKQLKNDDSFMIKISLWWGLIFYDTCIYCNSAINRLY